MQLHYKPRHVSSINCRAVCSHPAYCTAFIKSDDTRCCDNTICPPEDGHVNARNISGIVMLHTYCYRIK